MDHSSFTTEVKLHGGHASSKFGCVAVLNTGSAQLFLTLKAWEHMVRSCAASTICETRSPPRPWLGSGKFPPLHTSTTVRLNIQLLHEDKPTASRAVWAYIVPSEAMKNDVLLGHDSLMRFSERSSVPCLRAHATTACSATHLIPPKPTWRRGLRL